MFYATVFNSFLLFFQESGLSTAMIKRMCWVCVAVRGVRRATPFGLPELSGLASFLLARDNIVFPYAALQTFKNLSHSIQFQTFLCQPVGRLDIPDNDSLQSAILLQSFKKPLP